MGAKSSDIQFLTAMEEMLDVTISAPFGIEDFESKEDVVTFCLTTMTTSASNIVSGLSLMNLSGWKLDSEVIKHGIGIICTCLSVLGKRINLEAPSAQDCVEFLSDMPQEIKMSPFLSCMELLGNVSGLSYLLYVDSNLGEGCDKDTEKDLYSNYISILGCLQNLCRYLNIEVVDLQ